MSIYLVLMTDEIQDVAFPIKGVRISSSILQHEVKLCTPARPILNVATIKAFLMQE